MVCYAQHFSQLHAGTERRVYHNTPAWQWRPIMQLATGRLLLRCVTSRWKGPCSTASACPCTACNGTPEDPAHYVLECAGLAGSSGALSRCGGFFCRRAGGHTVLTVRGHVAMQALFQPKHFANFFVLAKRRRFAVDSGAQIYLHRCKPLVVVRLSRLVVIHQRSLLWGLSLRSLVNSRTQF
jgi:hypothetical protein